MVREADAAKFGKGWEGDVGSAAAAVHNDHMNSASGHRGLRTNVTALAVAILALAVVIEATAGFRLGEVQGSIAELGVAIAMIAASVLIFAQFGRSRRLLSALAAFGSVVILWAVNAAFSTSLDVAHGGAYRWSGTRVMVLTLFVGPIIGFVAAILTFGFSHLSAFNSAAPKR